jgi:hypothetical protein
MTITDLPPSGLLDRRSEREVPDRLAAGVLSGQTRVLALRAEALPERARSEYDLRKVFGELDVSLRRELGDGAMPL